MTVQASVGIVLASLLVRQNKFQYAPAGTDKEGKPTHSLELIEFFFTKKKLKAYS
jgi:hypothetical protein